MRRWSRRDSPARRRRGGAAGAGGAPPPPPPPSLDAEELAPLPRVFLGPVWAELVNGLAAAEVAAIGFDAIFEFSADRFFEHIGARAGNFDGQYDRSFRVALSRAQERIVLARSAQALPSSAFWGAVGGKEALALAELVPDGDGVQRWMRRSLLVDDGRAAAPTMAAALLERAKMPPMPPELLLAPARPLEGIPTYRLIDVLHCLRRDPDALRAAFAGRVVLVGTNLPEEDRKRTPDRFMRWPAGETVAIGRCRLARLGPSDPGSGTTPGVFVHAAAVEAVATGNLVQALPPAARAVAGATAGAAGALLGFLLTPLAAVAGLAVLCAAAFGAALVLLGFGWWFAISVPTGAAILSMVVAYVVRFLVEERRRRRIQNAFTHYLAPQIVDQLADSDAQLHLGGEKRDVTVMFADLSGFTALSGKVSATELMAVTNDYLGIIVKEVEATGGYVDKFIGDAVMGVWGAPVPDADHAASAARAALRAVAAVFRAKAEADARGEHGYTVKMGINSGEAVVGNVGAPQRYNYTAVGETVNVAARLEGVPGDYGCRIVVGPQTAAAIADRFVLCELDWIKVKGKADAIAIYELLGEKGDADAAALAYPTQFGVALKHYRDGDFAAAEAGWRKAVKHPFLDDAKGPSPAHTMVERCAELQAQPPENWDGVFVKTTK